MMICQSMLMDYGMLNIMQYAKFCADITFQCTLYFHHSKEESLYDRISKHVSK